jgi:hypothetical protein
MGKTFNEFMSEQQTIDRWFVLRVAVVGGFLGALLAVAFVLFALT